MHRVFLKKIIWGCFKHCSTEWTKNVYFGSYGQKRFVAGHCCFSFGLRQIPVNFVLRMVIRQHLQMLYQTALGILQYTHVSFERKKEIYYAPKGCNP